MRNFLVLLFVLVASTSSGAQTTAPVDRAAIDKEVKAVVISTTRAVLDELTGIEQLFFIQTKDAIEKLVGMAVLLSRQVEQSGLPLNEIAFIQSQRDLDLKRVRGLETLLARLNEYRAQYTTGQLGMSPLEANGVRLLKALRALEDVAWYKQAQLEAAQGALQATPSMLSDGEVPFRDQVLELEMLLLQIASSENARLKVIARTFKELREELMTAFQLTLEGVPSREVHITRAQDLLDGFAAMQPGFQSLISEVRDISIALIPCEAALGP